MRPSRRAIAALLLWAVLSAGAIAVLAGAQRQTRDETEQRFALRAAIASNFVSTYVADLVTRQREQARRHLGAASVSDAEFNGAVEDSGFLGAVLLDRRGRILQVQPSSPELIGKDITADYAHLREGVAGRVAISKVVPSAVDKVPVIAFAVPFGSASGRRVYSGAYDIATTPAGAYLRNAIPVPSSRLYLIDAAGVVIARNGPTPRAVQSLATLQPALADSLVDRREGTFEDDGVESRFASAPIAGTPWRIVIAVPSAALYESVNGASQRLPWMALFGFVIASFLAGLLFLRNLNGRSDLARLITLLEKVIRVDPLTDIYNRRGLDEQLERAVSAARRHRHPLALLLVDVDHFKRCNDAHGHQAGDAILAELASVMKDTLRDEDIVGRWGGEEFLIVLPDTALEGARMLAERLRATVASLEIDLPDGGSAGITISIGISAGTEGSPDQRIGAADRALYRAKANGRDRVEHDGDRDPACTPAR